MKKSFLKILLIVLLLECFISFTLTFSTLPVASNKHPVTALTTTASRLQTLVTWPTATATATFFNTDFLTLDKHSTNFDVLTALEKTDQFAPYVGSHGVAVVTGGTGGIGLPTIDALARTGMKIVVCTRDPEQARYAINKHFASSPLLVGSDSKIRIQPIDLSDLTSVEAAVQQIIRTEKKIDVLLNSAGTISPFPSKKLTAQHFELHLGVNHIAHHFLTRALLPAMRPWGRVVTVSSQAHKKVRNLVLDDLHYYNHKRRYCSYGAYCQSKLANILFSKALQDKLLLNNLYSSSSSSTSNILSLGVHPGTVMTNMWRKAAGEMVLGDVSDYMISNKTPEQGASSNVYCCLADASHFKLGDYVVDCKSSVPSSLAEEVELRSVLWDMTERMIQESGFDL